MSKVVRVIFAALLSCACAMGQGPGAATAAQQPASFQERLGEDDGAALALLFGANLRGNLLPCD